MWRLGLGRDQHHVGPREPRQLAIGGQEPLPCPQHCPAGHRRPGLALHCGFRDEDDLAAEHWVYLQADDDGACSIPTKVLSGHSFQYQVGYAVPDELDRPVVFLPWTDARTP